MISTLSAHLHFQCSFELCASAGLDDPWTSLAKTVRHWVSEAPRFCPPTTNPAFFGAWFFTGGDWRGPGPNFNFVRTARLIGNGSDREPQHWAVQYEHNCEMPGRVWRIDIGITRLAERTYRLSVVTSHYLRPGFIGREPPAPLPTAPRMVGRLLSSPDWEARAGTEILRIQPKLLKQGDGEELRRRLEDARRECPILVVSRDFQSGQLLLDTGKLARLLAGSASVYETESTGLDKELEWCLGRRFSCWNGNVRVYQQSLDFNAPGAPKRQRYFSGLEITHQGGDAVIDMLVRGVVRRAQPKLAGMAASIEDVAVFEREQRMAELKATANDAGREEWTKLLEETNSQLEASVMAKDEQIGQMQVAAADADDKIASMDYEKKALLARASEAEKAAKASRGRAEVAATLSTLPTSAREVVDLIARIHPDRIAFTERALKSADGCECNVADSWRCLWAMATTLHDLFFADDRNNNNLERAFLEQSGFRLAMTEGEMTKDDQKLMKQRKDSFNGVEIDCTPHVKIDKDSTRAYCCPFKSGDKKLVVVGYVGHLNTAGTRRRKN
jgi:hypothetical protein